MHRQDKIKALTKTNAILCIRINMCVYMCVYHILEVYVYMCTQTQGFEYTYTHISHTHIHAYKPYMHTLILSTNSCCSSNKYGDTSTPPSVSDAVVVVPEEPTPTPVLTGGVV